MVGERVDLEPLALRILRGGVGARQDLGDDQLADRRRDDVDAAAGRGAAAGVVGGAGRGREALAEFRGALAPAVEVVVGDRVRGDRAVEGLGRGLEGVGVEHLVDDVAVLAADREVAARVAEFAEVAVPAVAVVDVGRARGALVGHRPDDDVAASGDLEAAGDLVGLAPAAVDLLVVEVEALEVDGLAAGVVDLEPLEPGVSARDVGGDLRDHERAGEQALPAGLVGVAVVAGLGAAERRGAREQQDPERGPGGTMA